MGRFEYCFVVAERAFDGINTRVYGTFKDDFEVEKYLKKTGWIEVRKGVWKQKELVAHINPIYQFTMHIL